MRAGAAGAVVRAGLFTVLCWAQCSHISVFLYLYFCVCVFVFVFCIVLQHLCKVNCSQFCVGHDAHTAHGTRNTLHTAHGTMQRHKADGTMLTQRLNPPSSLQPLSANSSPHIASYPQHQVFQWELSTWTQLESKRFRDSSFGWVCPFLLSFYILLRTVERTLILISTFCIQYDV